MHTITTRAIVTALAMLAALPVVAQAQQTVRLRGQIVKVDGQTVTLKTRDGREATVRFADGGRVMALEKAAIGDIKPGAYIGVAAMPQPDGSQRALAVHIFTEAQRGVAEGHRPWDLAPKSTMTNAAVETIVAGVNGRVLTVKYKDGEQKIIVPPGAPIVAYAPGERSELKPGVEAIVFSATRQPDGIYFAPAITTAPDAAATLPAALRRGGFPRPC
jgi:hypothetical protein